MSGDLIVLKVIKKMLAAGLVNYTYFNHGTKYECFRINKHTVMTVIDGKEKIRTHLVIPAHD